MKLKNWWNRKIGEIEKLVKLKNWEIGEIEKMVKLKNGEIGKMVKFFNFIKLENKMF